MNCARPRMLLAAAAASALALSCVGCSSVASGDAAQWNGFLDTPFPQRVFTAPKEVLEKLYRDNLSTQSAYSFSMKEEAVPLAVPSDSRIFEFARQILAVLDPGVRRLTEGVFIGVFPVINIVNGCGVCVSRNGNWGRGYYLLLEDEPSRYGIRGAGQADFTYYTYNVDRDEFLDENGAALVFSQEDHGKSVRDHYRRLLEKSMAGTIVHELGHIVHFQLAAVEGAYSESVRVPREFVDISWKTGANGSLVSRFEEQRTRLDALSHGTWTPEASAAILGETSFVNPRSFQDPEEDFATAFTEYVLWRSNLEDATLTPNCTEEARFAQKKAYFDRIFDR